MPTDGSDEQLIEQQIVLDAWKSSEKIRDDSLITITHICDHRSLFVRPSSVKCDAFYANISVDLNVQGCNTKPLVELPKCGSIVLAHIGNEFHRVVILKAKSKNCPIKVFYLDWGNICEVSLSQLYHIRFRLRHTKTVLRKVNLYGVSADNPNDYQYQFLSSIYESKKPLILRNSAEIENTHEEVSLYFQNDSISLNDRIARIQRFYHPNVANGDDLILQHVTDDVPIFFYVIC